MAEALAPLAGEEVLLLVASEDETVRAWARRDLTELRHFELRVRGRDLVERGVEPGPRIGPRWTRSAGPAWTARSARRRSWRRP